MMLSIISPYIICIFIICSIPNGVVIALDNAESYTVINDEVYQQSAIPDVPNWGRSTMTETKVLTASSRDTFFEIFSRIESFKIERAVWSSTESGRRTLSNMKYLILPIWFNDEPLTPADTAKIAAVMEQTKVYYRDMSWNRHDITWQFLEQVQLVNISRANPTLNAVSEAAQKHILTLGMKYPDTHTGIIITYNVAATGDMNFGGGWGVINGNVTWMSMPPSFAVTRHEIGHNYGHPHHGSNTYNWRIGRGFSTNTLDGFDMMSGGNSPSRQAHFSAASKFFFNWIPHEAIISMQPEGSNLACPSCLGSINGFVLKPFDRTDITPSPTNIMAIHIPVMGVGSTSAYSYWLSYRSNFTESRVGLSIHVSRFNLGGLFGTQFDSLNFDAFGNSTTTKDSFVLPNSCYVVQPPGLLMDIDSTSAEQVKPVVCVDDIDIGNSITVSVSFLSKASVPPPIVVNDLGQLQCSVGGSSFGDQSFDLSDGQARLIKYNGTGIDGNITFSFCQNAGPQFNVWAFFYDSYPDAFLSYNAPPGYGSFMSLKASSSCSAPNATVYSSEYGQTFVVVKAEGVLPTGTAVTISSSCIVLNCHAGQYLTSSGVCTFCPAGSVSVAGSVGLENCVSCLDDGLEPVGAISKDCKVSKFADPTQNTGSLWRILTPMAHALEGWRLDVDELEFYSADDCRISSRISTTGGVPFDSGNAGSGWGPEKAFNSSWSWGGRSDTRGLFYLGIDFKKEVSVSCIIYKQPRLMVKELRIQTKTPSLPWKNVWIQRSFQNITVIPFVFSPTKAPTSSPTVPPVATPFTSPISSPLLSPALSPILSPITTSESSCDSPENECRGGFFSLFSSGQTMHRTILGSCSEQCNSFSFFRGLLTLLGWRCGSCLS